MTTDGVVAHSDLLTEFPYLGPPHTGLAAARQFINESAKASLQGTALNLSATHNELGAMMTQAYE